MYKLLILIFFCICPSLLFAQNSYSIKGSVADTSIHVKLENTSVIVLNEKDSILVDFTTVKPDGSFNISKLPAGNYILLLIYHGYADYTERFSLGTSSSSHDFGQISLIQKARLLQEVLINGTAAITIKGDTTEFNASSYKIQSNDRVEDLLRQLPGIEVDQNGRITARGRTVQKVLVDGEEFFGDDPTLVTKNIRADMVDKVQLFEKKSDQAAFTGIDDGKRTTTLNVTLKAEKKNGYFGKVDGGQAADKYYQGQAMFNAFQTKQKLSVYGTIGNTGRTGLSNLDNNKYGMTLSMIPLGDLLESFSGRYAGEGIPNAHTGGLHYDAKWNSDKESINMNYKIGFINVQGFKNVFSRNNFPLGFIDAVSDQNSDNDFYRQKLDAAYQVALSSTSNLKVTADAALSSGQLATAFHSSGTRNNTLLNSQDRRINNDSDQKIFNMTALLTKKFRKEGRTASLNLAQSL